MYVTIFDNIRHVCMYVIRHVILIYSDMDAPQTLVINSGLKEAIDKTHK